MWVDHSGNEAPIEAEGAAYLNPRLSPDGSWVAVEIASDDQDIWLVNLVSNGRRRLTDGPERESHPLWTPDGELVIFSRTHGVFSKAAAGSGPERPLASLRWPSFPGSRPVRSVTVAALTY